MDLLVQRFGGLCLGENVLVDYLEFHQGRSQQGTLLMDEFEVLQVLLNSLVLTLQSLRLQQLLVQKQVLEVVILVLHQGIVARYVGDDTFGRHLLQFLQFVLKDFGPVYEISFAMYSLIVQLSSAHFGFNVMHPLSETVQL